jgi:hypothetical protein
LVVPSTLLRVELGIGHRRADVDLRGEVEDDVGIDARDDVNQLGSLNIVLYQRESARVLAVAAVRALQVGCNAGAVVVNSDDLVAVGQETVNQR